MTRPWMLDELAHAGPEHLDPAFVAGYERKQGYTDPAKDLVVLAAHGLDATSTVVDLGAGTGRFALAAARRFGQVSAVDIPPMLQLPRERATAARVASLPLHAAGVPQLPARRTTGRRGVHPQRPAPAADFWKAVALDRIRGMLGPSGVLRLRDLLNRQPWSPLREPVGDLLPDQAVPAQQGMSGSR